MIKSLTKFATDSIVHLGVFLFRIHLHLLLLLLVNAVGGVSSRVCNIRLLLILLRVFCGRHDNVVARCHLFVFNLRVVLVHANFKIFKL